MRTKLQTEADRRTAALRRSIATDLRRLREDAGLTRSAVAIAAGVDSTTITKVEAGQFLPTLELYGRLAAALGADLHARPYPSTGPAIHDRHQVRIAELLLATLHARWQSFPEVAVRRPARGFVDVTMFDPRAAQLVPTELESDLRRVEQIVRWSADKAASLPSSDPWQTWSRDRSPEISRLLIVRRTRGNREVALAARRLLREAYPADPRDALESLVGTAAWPGPALLWARLDADRARLSVD
jgi:transcriptional regulator with XRE-family HTH domain